MTVLTGERGQVEGPFGAAEVGRDEAHLVVDGCVFELTVHGCDIQRAATSHRDRKPRKGARVRQANAPQPRGGLTAGPQQDY